MCQVFSFVVIFRMQGCVGVSEPRDGREGYPVTKRINVRLRLYIRDRKECAFYCVTYAITRGMKKTKTKNISDNEKSSKSKCRFNSRSKSLKGIHRTDVCTYRRK